ncbi:MAG: alpha/beta hydrolase [Pseudomonadota bacterium]
MNFKPHLRNLIASFLALSMLTACSAYPWQYHLERTHYTIDLQPLSADIYLPELAEKTPPVVIVVHGGGWVRRSGDMTGICKQLATNGIAAVNITYRSALEHPYPAAIEDVRAALAWVRNKSDELPFDSSRIALWGYSAGGHLALMAGLAPEENVSAIVSGGTPARFVSWPQSPVIQQFIGHPITTHRHLWEEASPVNHVKAGSPPVFLYHGENDDLVEPEQMTLMAAALDKKGTPVETFLVHNRGHFGTYLFGDEAEQAAIDFLKSHFLM